MRPIDYSATIHTITVVDSRVRRPPTNKKRPAGDWYSPTGLVNPTTFSERVYVMPTVTRRPSSAKPVGKAQSNYFAANDSPELNSAAIFALAKALGDSASRDSLCPGIYCVHLAVAGEVNKHPWHGNVDGTHTPRRWCCAFSISAHNCRHGWQTPG
jgi:hypothetical protein